METPYSFGADGSLTGILCRPDAGEDPNRPTVVIPNAYVTPHVGLFRMHVEIARALAAAGFRSFRFDASGIGDSSDRPDAPVYAQRVREDLHEAVRFAGDACGTDDVVLLGHCDGGNHAFLAALDEPNVRGLVCIDAFMQPSWRYWLGAFGRRLKGYLDVTLWRERLRRRAGKTSRSSMLSLRSLAGEGATLYMGGGSLDQVAAGAATLCQREAPALWIFSGEYLRIGRFADVRSTLDAAQTADLIEQHIIRDARHIYPELGHRRLLVETIVAWMTRRFGEPAGARTTGT